MRTPAALRNLDDRVLGRKDRSTPREHDGHRGQDDHVYPDEPHGSSAMDRSDQTHDDHRADPDEHREPSRDRRPAGAVVRDVLGVVWTVARYVFLALALVVFLGIVLTWATTNDDNTLVSTLLSWAEWAAGPFRDVFTAEPERREVLFNYGLATAVYLLAASLVGKLPGGRSGARD